jgi:hypothetical protein
MGKVNLHHVAALIDPLLVLNYFSLSLGSYWFGEGAREGEGAVKKGGGASGRKEHEQEEGEQEECGF